MKKKYIIIGIISILIIAIIITILILTNNKQTTINLEEVINDNINYISKLSYEYNNTGNIEVVANYRGAHGENNPHDFKYLFKYDNNNLYILNDEGYAYLDNFNYLDLFNYLHNIKNSITIKDNIVEVDPTTLSSLINIKIDRIYFDTVKDIIKLHIIYDNKEDVIEFNNNLTQGRGTFLSKEVKYNKTSQGISLQYDKDIKMNIFTHEDNIEYNIVNKDYTYKLKLYEDKINLITSGDASIYRGLEISFIFNKLDINLDKEIDYKDICVVRYFKSLGHVGSEY